MSDLIMPSDTLPNLDEQEHPEQDRLSVRFVENEALWLFVEYSLGFSQSQRMRDEAFKFLQWRAQFNEKVFAE